MILLICSKSDNTPNNNEICTIKIETVPRLLIFHCAAKINQPRNAAKQKVLTARDSGLRWRPKPGVPFFSTAKAISHSVCKIV